MPTFWKNKKPKKTSPEDKAWTAFSQYVRLRDCFATVGTEDVGRCVTCMGLSTNKGNDAGHYVSRGRTATKYDPMNVHLQCAKCNRFQQGNWIQYREFMVSFYGKEKTESLELRSNALEKKYVDWDSEAARWRMLRKTLSDAFKFKSQFERRETVSALMKEGTLEEFLEITNSRKKAKKDLQSET